ncbi:MULTISPECIES: Hint domain-containing protein [unclassified Ruegeria]|uniref:Hint domain-containing protein n=1 Tax=unclassified Ruegeria TaxID=2625375 RepID=UPI001489BE83|nr:MULTISPECIES: Hint domain-containing protein [unclassified Ruegeria]
MPTTYTDQFFVLDPANPGANGTVVGSTLTVSQFDIVDQNDNGLINRLNNDSVDGQDITASYFDDIVTIQLPGGGQVTYTGVTFYLADGREVFTPTDGQLLQQGTFVSSSVTDFSDTGGSFGSVDIAGGELAPPCFTAGTLIETPKCQRRVEDLQPGDLVMTLDRGAQPLLWTGKTTVAANDTFAPVRFSAGTFGLSHPLLVSPQHRMLIDDWRAQYFYGHSEILIAAHCLVNGDTVTRAPVDEIDYYHLLFDRHEIIFANGAKNESYYPGHAVTQAERRTQAEILALFPELSRTELGNSKTVRPVIRSREARLIAN